MKKKFKTQLLDRDVTETDFARCVRLVDDDSLDEHETNVKAMVILQSINNLARDANMPARYILFSIEAEVPKWPEQDDDLQLDIIDKDKFLATSDALDVVLDHQVHPYVD